MKKIIYGIFIILFIILCFVFNRYDLNISINLTKFNNNFYEFFDDYGELPVYIGPILFGAIYYFLSEKKVYKMCSLGICGLGYLIAVFKVFHNKDANFDFLNIILILLISMTLFLLTMFLFSKTSKENLCKIKDLALVGLITTVVSVTCVEILKTSWGRVRFRDLSEDYHEFTKLFEINGYTGNKSFPSGHTNAATSILLISLIVARFTDKKWIKYLVTVACFGYILTVAFSRIVVSAHYASDVMCGFAVGLITIKMVYYFLKRKGVINASSNKC